jgi:NAD(P)-dependent dehydrogenase (short-subunit alcohol dehydrogenase family)
MFAKDFLAGKAAIVTGGARGLGFLFAAVLAAQGASVPIQGVASSEAAAARLTPRRRPSQPFHCNGVAGRRV